MRLCTGDSGHAIYEEPDHVYNNGYVNRLVLVTKVFAYSVTSMITLCIVRLGHETPDRQYKQ